MRGGSARCWAAARVQEARIPSGCGPVRGFASFRSNEGFSRGWRSKEGGNKQHRAHRFRPEGASATQGGEYVYGLQSVEAALARHRALEDVLRSSGSDVNTEGCTDEGAKGSTTARRVHRLFLQTPGRDGESQGGGHDDGDARQGVNGKRSAGAESIEEMAKELGLPVDYLPRRELTTLVGPNNVHQGVVLHCSALRPALANYMERTEPQQREGRAPLWVALDEVWDPHNFGAIVRSAMFFGARGIILSERNSCPPSPHVSKASAGALEFARLYRARHLPQFLHESSRRGWNIVGTAMEADACPSHKLSLRAPTILVLGNEGYGLRPSVRSECTMTTKIEHSQASGECAHGSYKLDSLNVSVAAGILIHQLSTSLHGVPPPSS